MILTKQPNLICPFYQAELCQSCTWLAKPYSLQLAEKQHTLIAALQPFCPEHIAEPVASAEFAFRNKAKMAVLGTVEKPILGIMHHQQAVDLCQCPLYDEQMQRTLAELKHIIKTLQLVPYNINKKKGELKFIILTQAQNQFMLRFVLRSSKMQAKLADSIAWIQQMLPQIVVISINIQPIHAAVLEGETEIILTENESLPVLLNNVPLFIRSSSFFQTNSDVAAKLYQTAQNWLAPLPIHRFWDLFCGVGGFGLHCITDKRDLLGIEINPEAIACAKKSAQLMGFHNLDFQSLDATKLALSDKAQSPNLILVNPPRRGIGQALIDEIQQISPDYIMYSSCNLTSLINDLSDLKNYQIINAQLFDMFPHTEHMEILTLLAKRSASTTATITKIGN